MSRTSFEILGTRQSAFEVSSIKIFKEFVFGDKIKNFNPIQVIEENFQKTTVLKSKSRNLFYTKIKKISNSLSSGHCE